MSLDSNLNINITIGGPNIDRASFQQVAFVADFGFSERTRTYTGVQQVDDDESNGDLTSGEADKMRSFFTQSRHTDELIAGRRDSDQAQVDEITVDSVGSASQGDTAAIDINGSEATHTLGSSPTTDSVASGLETEINNLSEPVTASVSGSTVTVTADTAGEGFSTAVGDSNDDEITYTITTTTDNISIATELAAIETDNSDWYAFTLDNEDKTDFERAAEWTEPRLHQFWGQTSSTDVRDNVSGNIKETINNDNRTRSTVLYHTDSTEPFALCFLGDFFGVDPDSRSTTTSYKTLETIATDDISGQTKTNLDDLGVSYYTTFYGTDSTQAVEMGSGDRAELVLARDWLKSRLQEDIAEKLKFESDRGSKVPYTNEGVDTLVAIVTNRLQDGEAIDHFVDGSSEVSAPDLQDISASDRRNNILKDLEFGTEPALSIDKVDPIQGYIDVDFGGF